MNNLAATIGKNIANLRKAKGLTQQELAKEINYTDKSISKWELGYAAPSIDILIEIARFFGVSVDYLLTEQSDESIKNVIDSEETQREVKNKRIAKALILAMSMVFCVLVAISFFFSPYFFHPNEEHGFLWQAFVWLIPCAMIIAAVETWKFYHNRIASVVLASLFVWSLLIAFAVQFAYGNSADSRQSVWFILSVGIPVQAIIILYVSYRYYR